MLSGNWERELPEDIRNALSRTGAADFDRVDQKYAGDHDTERVSRTEETGKAYYYRARILKDEARKNMISDLLMNAFDGSESLIVAALLDTGEIREEELEEIRRLVADTGGEEAS